MGNYRFDCDAYLIVVHGIYLLDNCHELNHLCIRLKLLMISKLIIEIAKDIKMEMKRLF